MGKDELLTFLVTFLVCAIIIALFVAVILLFSIFFPDLTIERGESIKRLKTALDIAEKQRDNAIADLEEIMLVGGQNIDTCDYCKRTTCYGRGGSGLCVPKWKGPAKE